MSSFLCCDSFGWSLGRDLKTLAHEHRVRFHNLAEPLIPCCHFIIVLLSLVKEWFLWRWEIFYLYHRSWSVYTNQFYILINSDAELQYLGCWIWLKLNRTVKTVWDDQCLYVASQYVMLHRCTRASTTIILYAVSHRMGSLSFMFLCVLNFTLKIRNVLNPYTGVFCVH